jgi:hypothetical protein
MMFVGDSLNRNQWESMVCLVQSAVAPDKKYVKWEGQGIVFHAWVRTLPRYDSCRPASITVASCQGPPAATTTMYTQLFDSFYAAVAFSNCARASLFFPPCWWRLGKLGAPTWPAFLCIAVQVERQAGAVVVSSMRQAGTELTNSPVCVDGWCVQEFNATVEFYWAPFLVESNSDDPKIHSIQHRIIKADEIAKHAENWRGVDYLIFNTYIWWMNTFNMKVMYVLHFPPFRLFFQLQPCATRGQNANESDAKFFCLLNYWQATGRAELGGSRRPGSHRGVPEGADDVGELGERERRPGAHVRLLHEHVAAPHQARTPSLYQTSIFFCFVSYSSRSLVWPRAILYLL